ncbi:NADH-quinone oxidoreductase subunit C [Streptomyces olivaceus]|uniref:NADH-quinone oxidoreductase subunit C n=1 Tax=Streptomyces olivaceus TaxID=47716 RepID=A0ABS7VVQ4_STROV|nr:NADH-quinone oxidoreductase subunit C [Streptomyces olivaceus]MBZ6086930.1 NADH-quinone oxidoreductase subunit C [Streptomyces olivaceus]MBZ6094469.1 NADH-quinone oxidoreductase subunit C [Streptomyces olivaceus]MBZ6115585.1 NADH-quinone oxidoreductase subunit C [Streptomyces olivaceus]MBZ6149774.1 NADH-quinone oxidoreductase subunit C [Streptomyces olivaceus]MBZ6193357.1 NADH-quinone oxidoreductase subunit C [Streptomyces olivaceus]
MTAAGWLPADPGELFGAEAAAEESYGLLTVDVPPASWIPALRTARDRLGCTYFDWLSAVDEPGTGFRVAAHVVALGPVRRLLLRTTVPHGFPVLPTAVEVYAGAAWHERETHEMFGVAFEDHPALDHLLLPEGFEGHPLRKDFVLAARVAKAWPGAKEPGESEHGGPRRRQMLPPGVPDPNEWGPLKGQLPPAPARPARGAGRAAGERPARAAGDRPPRRTRTAAEGSATQTTTGADAPASGAGAPASGAGTPAGGAGTPASGAETPAGGAAPRRSRSASQGSASQRAAATPAASPADEAAAEPSPSAPRSSDAPWHHARPAFDEPTGTAEPTQAAEPTGAAEPETPDARRVSDESEATEEPEAAGSTDAPGDSRNPTDPTDPTKPQKSPPPPPPPHPPNPPHPPTSSGGTQ